MVMFKRGWRLFTPVILGAQYFSPLAPSLSVLTISLASLLLILEHEARLKGRRTHFMVLSLQLFLVSLVNVLVVLVFINTHKKFFLLILNFTSK